MKRPSEYMKRLEALNGRPLRHEARERDERDAGCIRQPAPYPVSWQRGLPSGSSPLVPYTGPERTVLLEEALPGEEIPALDRGVVYCISTPVRQMAEEWAGIGAAYHQAFAEGAGARQRLAKQCQLADVTPNDVIFLDLETTGLGQTPLFLIGTMAWDGQDLMVRQYLARHFGEEASAVALFCELAQKKRLLITFNGKRFDWPFLMMRAAANAVPFMVELAHFDLLHESRRVWKGALPNCKLQTLEQYVCGHPSRSGDIPGADIPGAYLHYLRTRNAAQLVKIISHNLLDLVTMADLLAKLPPL